MLNTIASIKFIAGPAKDTKAFPFLIEIVLLKLFGFTVPITFEVEPKDNDNLTYEKDLAIYRAKTNDVNLPATVYEETWTEYQVQQIQLTEEQALQKAKEELEKQQKEALKEDDKVLSTDTTYTIEKGQLILHATSIWEENIAQESEIYVEQS